MKSTVKAAVLLTLSSTLSFTLFGAALVHAQTYGNPPFQHVIIVIQENRTPDNLFGAAAITPYPSTLPPLGPGYDLQLPPDQMYENQSQPVPWCLGTCFDPGHEHGDWLDQYAQGGTSYNACANKVSAKCTGQSDRCNNQSIGTGPNQIPPPSCWQETYTSPTYDAQYYTNPQNPNQTSPLVPYFDIASKYGFANYFFQTNQGPSQPAHDFLFGGTSSPTGALLQTGDTSYYYQLFAGDNVNGSPSGCGTNTEINLIFPNSQQTDSNYNNGNAITAPPCFERQTLADLLDNASPQLTWRYYTTSLMDIWTAPSGIQHLCYPLSGTTCNSPYFNPTGNPNVIAPPETFFADFPLGTNLPGHNGTCNLPNVTWIVPNGNWSDHPGGVVSTDVEHGPDWVASIINAVGNASCVEPAGPYAGQSPWNDTVIFVVWDDWGGFYDHVGSELPFTNPNNPFPFLFGDQYTGGPNGSNDNNGCLFTAVQGGNWGCGYTYGWRVPFLVVSKWTPNGYVSGACGTTQKGLSPCPQPGPYNVHDFGSILAFIENNFLGLTGIGTINSTTDSGNGYSGTGYPFADAYYPEGQVSGGPYLPLGDFFGLWWNSENSVCTQQGTNDGCPRSFDAIQCVFPTNYNGDPCPGYFTSYTGPVEDPDNDVIDDD